MRITAMGNWRPQPGMAVRFDPTEACREAASSTPDHPAPVTFLAQNHVRGAAVARAAGRTHRGYLGSGTEIDGDLDTAALGAALTLFVRRHEVLRTWFECRDGDVTAHLVDSADVDFEGRVDRRLETADDVHPYLIDRFDHETPSDAFPGFAFGAISRPGGFALFLACDHALSDGASQALALDEIAQIYLELIGAGDPDHATDAEPAPAVGGYFTYAAAEAESTAQHLAGSPQTRAWQEIFRRHDLQMPRFPLDLGLAAGDTAQVTGVEVSLLDGAGIAAFDAACRGAGGRFIDGIYAAIAITDRELAGADEYYGMTVFNTRAALDGYATSQGWFCTFAPVEFSLTTASTFAELIPAAHTARRRARDLATVPVAAALAAIAAAGATPDAIITAPNLLSYIDFRWFPGTSREAFRRGALFTGEGRTANASAWINRDHDELYLGSQIPGTPFAESVARHYYDHLRAVVADIARTGDRQIRGPAATPGPADPVAAAALRRGA
ncbi:condensation domain-containing protein [Gordonia lacunae]|uniref:Peptide synthase n=1 Tax=Gordonia lacunae TaxID=417102 RepID=A0A243Q992_9ACTN|nr:condensation domain-containing protein [Gordonia lacunae]OUC78252.1 peptide synthase [Gordonia lacunae]